MSYKALISMGMGLAEPMSRGSFDTPMRVDWLGVRGVCHNPSMIYKANIFFL